MPFVIINFSLADLIGVGSSVPISISLGKKQEEEAKQYFYLRLPDDRGHRCADRRHCLFAAAPLLIRLMGAEGAFADLAVQYIRVYALCSPVTTIVFAMDNFLRICGYIRGSMFLNILMSALSAVLEFVFLSVLGWGDLGSGAGHLHRHVSSAPLLASDPIPAAARRCCDLCKPAVQRPNGPAGRRLRQPQLFEQHRGAHHLHFDELDLWCAWAARSAVSVYGILMYAEGFIQPLLYGMCDSLQPAVGYNWGAGKFSRVRAIEKCCFCASGIVSIGGGLPHCVAARTDRAPVYGGCRGPRCWKWPVGALRLFSLTYVTRWFSFATQSYMLAIEKPVAASLISVSTALVFPVLLVAAAVASGADRHLAELCGDRSLGRPALRWDPVENARELSRPDLD